MESKLKIKRINLLIQRYFFENFTKEILFWSSIIFIFTILDNRIFVIFVLFISGLIYSARLSKDLLKGPNGMHYLLIPATQTEKMTAHFFLSTIYHFFMILLSYTIGNLLVTLIYHVIIKLPVPVNWDLFVVSNTMFVNGFIVVTKQNVFFQIFGVFAILQAVFTLGSLYFKNNIIIKTFFSIVFIGVLLFFIQMALFKTIWDIKYISNAFFPMLAMINDATIPAVVDSGLTIGSFVFLPFLWVVSYFRLTEKQI